MCGITRSRFVVDVTRGLTCALCRDSHARDECNGSAAPPAPCSYRAAASPPFAPPCNTESLLRARWCSLNLGQRLLPRPPDEERSRLTFWLTDVVYRRYISIVYYVFVIGVFSHVGRVRWRCPNPLERSLPRRAAIPGLNIVTVMYRIVQPNSQLYVNI